MTKEQELQMNNYYLELKKDGIITKLHEAMIFKLSYEKAFSLNGVVASVLCVKSKGYKDLQKGKKYELIDELVLDYVIVDDEGCNYRYPKELFERIK
tara:strand:- start:331 stop:621 length:291 start_codon:yes stop_codon:yes gene_type:complete